MQADYGGSKIRPDPTLFDKRILNPQLLDRLPMVKVFGIEDRATRSQRRGNDEAVVGRKTAIARDFDCRFVQFPGQRQRRIEESFQDAEGIMDFVPAASLFATRNIHEFIQDLNADDTAAFQQGNRPFIAGIV
jgi:hypothetical protein